MALSHARQYKFISMNEFNKEGLHVHVVGCGAVGSKVALEVAKMGVETIHLYDMDRVEGHNLDNQEYCREHVGMKKVEALVLEVERQAEMKAIPHDCEVDENTKFSGIVFICTDSMSSRHAVVDACTNNIKVKLVIEQRLSTMEGRVYSINPCNPRAVASWKDTATYSDEEAESATEMALCSSKVMISNTATFAKFWMINFFMKWVMYYKMEGEWDILPEDILIYDLGSPNIWTYKY